MTDILHYPGDVTDVVDNKDFLYGPDMYGAYYTAVSAVYDADTDRTAVTLKSIAPGTLHTMLIGQQIRGKRNFAALSTLGLINTEARR